VQAEGVTPFGEQVYLRRGERNEGRFQQPVATSAAAPKLTHTPPFSSTEASATQAARQASFCSFRQGLPTVAPRPFT